MLKGRQIHMPCNISLKPDHLKGMLNVLNLENATDIGFISTTFLNSLNLQYIVGHLAC